jgi:hypothetical protein
MDAETRRQLGELDELRNAHKARLQVLEVQAARSGNTTPPEVVTEIGDIKAKLVPIDAAIFKLTYVGTVRADVPGNDRHDQVGYAVERTLERERRANAARQIDVELLTEVRLTTAVEAMRQTLIAVGGLALAALLIAVSVAVYLVSTKGGL